MTERILESRKALEALSVKELKNILKERDVDFSDCFEKEELITKVIETDEKKTSIGKAPSRTEEIFGGVLEWKEKITGLDCIGVEPTTEGKNEIVVIVCHGYGANNEDLVPIARSILNSAKLPHKIQFVFPDGILSLGGKSKAWTHIDINELMMGAMRGEFDKLTNQDFNGQLPEARKRIVDLLQELKHRSGLPTNKILLAGFSQGAMLVSDVAFHLDETPAGLCVFSGALVNKGQWLERASNRKGMRVLQCHGKQDPILPYQIGSMLKEFFEKQSLNYEFISFNGGHTIDGAGLQKFVEMLRNTTANSTL